MMISSRFRLPLRLVRRRKSRPPVRRPWVEALEWRQLLDAGGVLAAESLAEAEEQQVADFELVDVNPNSTTHNQPVSPRDFLGSVSAWYFGHST